MRPLMLAMLGLLMRPASISFDKLQQFLGLRISVGPEATVSKGPKNVSCPRILKLTHCEV